MDKTTEVEQAAEDSGRSYSEADLEAELKQRLRGQGKEIARLQSAAEELEKLKSEQAAQALKRAEEQGEFEKLHAGEKQRADALSEQVAKMTESMGALKQLLASEIESTVKAIDDPARQKRLQELLKDRDVMDQRAILHAFVADAGAAQPVRVVQGNPGGKPAPKKFDPVDFASDPQALNDYAVRKLEELMASK